MGGKKRIDIESVGNPEFLAQLLNAFDIEIDSVRDLVNELRSDIAAARAPLVGDALLTGASLGIGSTKDLIANVLFMFMINGALYILPANAVGTEPGDDTVPQGKYGAVALDIGADLTLDAIEAPDNADPGYDTAIEAYTDLPAVAADHVRLGWVTAMKSDGAFIFGTTLFDAANTTVAFVSSTPEPVPYTFGTAMATTAAAVVEKVVRGT